MSGLFDSIANRAVNAASGAIEGKIKGAVPHQLGDIVGIAKSALRGDMSALDIGSSIINSGAFLSKIPLGSNLFSQALFFDAPSPAFGGISPREAMELHKDASLTKYAKKNLFLIEITDLSPTKSRDKSVYRLNGDGIKNEINLFATDISYSPSTIKGERRNIGSTSTNSVHASEAMDIRITTMDTQSGILKRWFRGKCDQAAPSDGTVGLPVDYLVKIKILHSFIKDELADRSGKLYSDVIYARPANIDMELSRRDKEMGEITMTFEQFDNFFTVS